MRLAVYWPITYWSSSAAISCGVGRSDLVPVTDSTSEVSSRMMSLNRSIHSSQMNTDGPAMSFLTSCWLLPQNEQYKSFSPLEPFFSDMLPVPHYALNSNQLYRGFRSPPNPGGPRRARTCAGRNNAPLQVSVTRVLNT